MTKRRRPKELEARRRTYAAAVALIEEKLGDPELTLERVAAQLAISPRHLQRVFAEIGGTGWRSLLDGTRMSRARALLKDPALNERGLSVREVSRRVGYYQPAGFAKAFRRHFGVAPHEVRPRLPARRAAITEMYPEDRSRSRLTSLSPTNPTRGRLW